MLRQLELIDRAPAPRPRTEPLIGFIPTAEHSDTGINLHHFLIKSYPSTFFYQADDSCMMTGAGICADDLLILDRAVKPQPGDLVIAMGEEGPMVRRLVAPRPGQLMLIGEVLREIDVVPCAERVSEIMGVVTRTVHQARRD